MSERSERTMSTHEVAVTVNGEGRTVRVEARDSLADVVRRELALTGTHLACEHGVCGACTVLLDGEVVRSCLVLAVQADGRSVTTVEGLAPAGELSPVQRGFYECHSFQCGYCTPGIVVTTHRFLQDHPSPTEAEVREMLAANLCRCTGYQSIVAGVLRAAELLRTRDGSTKDL
jgi:carbon-monoxide dehydrogenase small subunit